MKWITDNRGAFLEVFKKQGEGQVSVLYIEPNTTRGNHYHKRKREEFVVIAGTATLEVRQRLMPQEEFAQVLLNGEEPKAFEVTPDTVHNIRSGPEGCIVLLWCNEHFNPEDPDTYPEVVR
jgi:UDP-2-acetamido-2,6-beta-L-arabino-hexul-4-ose reductase